MGIQLTTPQAEIDAYIAQQLERREKAVINIFNYIGTACINEARNNGAYNDITAKLRNSIGYVIVKNGKIVSGSTFDFKEDGWDGKAAGEDYLKKLAAFYTYGIVLIVVAGMNYASYVEAMGLNVLSSAELLAEKLVPQLLKQLVA